jgi:futalosine hydrolase
MEVKHEICVMQILVISATAQEVIPFTSSNPEIDVLVAGVGIPSTMYHLQKRMQQIDYDCIIQAGIAGSFTSDIEPGRVVVVKQDTFADVGMEEKEHYTTIFGHGLADKDEFPFKDGWLINPHKIFSTQQLLTVKAITVNKVSDNPLQNRQFVQQFGPQVESMEGAALHYICLQENITFLQLRAVSNEVGIRDKTKWKMEEAINNLNTELSKLVNELRIPDLQNNH